MRGKWNNPSVASGISIGSKIDDLVESIGRLLHETGCRGRAVGQSTTNFVGYLKAISHELRIAIFEEALLFYSYIGRQDVAYALIETNTLELKSLVFRVLPTQVTRVTFSTEFIVIDV